MANGAKDSARHLHHLESKEIVAKVSGSSAIFQNNTFKASIVSFTECSVNTYISGNARKNEVSNALCAQQQLEISCIEGALARLVDDDLIGCWFELRDDIPTKFTADKNSATGARFADRCTDLLASPQLVCRQIREIRTMAFARVNHHDALLTTSLQNALDGFDRLAHDGNVIAHLIDIAALGTEVDLHIDHNQSGIVLVELAIVRPCVRLRLLDEDFGRFCFANLVMLVQHFVQFLLLST